tara:strand:+ start:251 stop:943 length:693 start_codon:yes stop_codon:yes gene_type:complete
MADVDSYGQLVMTNGQVIPLANTAQTEAAEEEIPTDANFVGSAQNAGTYATQTLGSQVVSFAGVNAENDMTYAFVRSAGKIKLALPVSGLNSGSGLPARLPYPKQLVSGDQVVGMANAVSDREVGLSVACTNGEYHVFSVTPSGAGEHELVSILTGLSIGETLQGRTVSHAFAMGGNNSANFSSPIYIVNGSGVPIGSVTANDPAVDSGTYEPCRAQIALNSRAVFRTDA